MKYKVALLSALITMTTASALAQSTPTAAALSPVSDPSITNRPEPKPIKAQKIILVGDSTTQVGSGWGSGFCSYHVTSFLACVNLGRGGRSTYSYRAEGSWDIALDEMKSAGYTDVYVLVQFGHNDQPGKAGRSTNLATEFPANLKRYVEEARSTGAKPVLVTPLTRRSFKDGKLEDDLGPWAEAVKQVAAEMNVPLIDLHAHSMEAVQAMGAGAAIRLAEIPPPPEAQAAADAGTTISVQTGVPAATPPTLAPQSAKTEPVGSIHLVFDYTHLGREGADLFAKIVADDLATAVPELRKDIIP